MPSFIAYSDDNRYSLKVNPDDYPIHPREDDYPWLAGNLICFDRHREIGDKHSYESPFDLYLDLAMQLDLLPDTMFDIDGCFIEEYSMEILPRVVESGRIVMLPVYLSSNQLYVGNACKKREDISDDKNILYSFDRGQIGWFYMLEDEIKLQYSVECLTDEVMQRAATMLTNEIQRYSQYLFGEIYMFSLVDEATIDVISSCSNVYSKEDMLDLIPNEYHYLVDRLEEYTPVYQTVEVLPRRPIIQKEK